MLSDSSTTCSSMNVFPIPDIPQMKTFSPEFRYVCRRLISFACIVFFLIFFCIATLTYASMVSKRDDISNQAIDIILENDALQKRIIEPVKRRLLPYLLCIGFFNIALFLLVVFIAYQSSPSPSSSG